MCLIDCMKVTDDPRMMKEKTNCTSSSHSFTCRVPLRRIGAEKGSASVLSWFAFDLIKGWLCEGKENVWTLYHTVMPDYLKDSDGLTFHVLRTLSLKVSVAKRRRRGEPWPLRALLWRTSLQAITAVTGTYFNPSGALPQIKSSNKIFYTACRRCWPSAHPVNPDMRDRSGGLVCN